jgi:hypothetical protein
MGPGYSVPSTRDESIRSTVRHRHWNRSSIAPHGNGAKRHFRVTHPFHPLAGSEFELVEYRNNWGEDRVYFHDADGRLQSILASCTDAGGVDSFLEIASGRSLFRYEDLIKLADLLEKLR